MSSAGAASLAAVPISNARAEASRRNGAKSRGPRTAAGKARSAQNALKHGLSARKLLVLPEEDAARFQALEAALLEELAPVGALQAVLAQRVVSAAWRLLRADRIEAEVLEFRRSGDGSLGLAVIRDGNGTRSFETVLRYRNAAMAELLRAQKALQALQAAQALRTSKPATEPGKRAVVAESAPRRTVERTQARSAERGSDQVAGKIRPQANPIRPDTGGKPNEPKRLPRPRSGRTLTGQPVPAPALEASASLREGAAVSDQLGHAPADATGQRSTMPQ